MRRYKIRCHIGNLKKPTGTRKEARTMTIDQINKDQHRIMRTTKYLIPTLKPNQFDPIPITGRWEHLESKNAGFATMPRHILTVRWR